MLQQQLVDKFNSDFGQAYSLKKSNIEYYFHPDALKRYYFHLQDEDIEIFEDDEDLKEYFKEKRINKNHNVTIFESMTFQEWEAVVEQELLDFISLLK